MRKSCSFESIAYYVILFAIVFALGVAAFRDLRADPQNRDLTELARSYVQPQQGTPRYEYLAVCRSTDIYGVVTRGVVIELDREPGHVYGSLWIDSREQGLTFYHLGGQVYSAPITAEMLGEDVDSATVKVIVTSPATGFPNTRKIYWNPHTHVENGAIIDFKERDVHGDDLDEHETK